MFIHRLLIKLIMVQFNSSMEYSAGEGKKGKKCIRTLLWYVSKWEKVYWVTICMVSF